MNEADYQRALSRISQLAASDPEAGTPEADELQVLAMRVEEFERIRYPMTCCAQASKAAVERALRLVALLTDFYGAQNAFVWFHAAQPLLDGQRPIDMVVTEEGAAELTVVVERLRSGAYV